MKPVMVIDELGPQDHLELRFDRLYARERLQGLKRAVYQVSGRRHSSRGREAAGPSARQLGAGKR